MSVFIAIIVYIHDILLINCGVVALRVGRRTWDQEVAGSTPGRVTAEYNYCGQVVYTTVPLASTSKLVIWYGAVSGDVLLLGR